MSKKNREEHLLIIKPILEHDEYLKRKSYRHHKNKTVYDHCYQVSYWSYRIAKIIPRVDQKSTALGGMLHDFYDRPWMEDLEKRPLLKKHGFVHAKEARDNSYKYFPELMNKKIENMILRHMFPLNITPPKYIESWIVTITDKIISIEVLFQLETIICIFKSKKGSKKHE